MTRFAFIVGESYSRRDIRSAIGLSPDERGGKVDTGYFEHAGAFFLLSNVSVRGRTGHDYGDHFEGDELVWSGKTGSRLSHPSIQATLGQDAEVHAFWRRHDRDPFQYLGLATAVSTDDVVPVAVRWVFRSGGTRPVTTKAEEVGSSFPEGGKTRVYVNRYERDPAARAACIEKHGTACACCEFDFCKVYGPIGKGFIHVHHLVPVSEMGEGYETDPVHDLVPVCPNCHAMLHRSEPAMSIEALRAVIATARTALAAQ